MSFSDTSSQLMLKASPVLQSPSLTLAWAAALNNTLLPLVSFVIDISGFTVTKSVPEQVQQTLYSVFNIVSFIAGPSWL